MLRTANTSPPPLPIRLRRVLRSARGAFDLPSIITGVVVVGILAAGVFAAVFGVIPFAQDNGAKQDLSAIRTAEGVARAKDNRFMNGAGLIAAGYIGDLKAATSATDANGTCYVAVAKSNTGSLFYSTDKKTEPELLLPETVPGCIDAPAVASLVSAVGGHSSALAQPEVSLVSFGRNTSGQLGVETAADSNAPLGSPASLALGGKTVTKVSTGGTHSCAIADGKAYCWGDDNLGQLGNGAAMGSSISPVPVDTAGILADKTVTDISAGGNHTCAVADGRAYCWGYSGYISYDGQLGNGSAYGQYVHSPVAVDATGALAGKTVTAITTSRTGNMNGIGHSCAIADGAAYCWGSNTGNQLGTGVVNNQEKFPKAVVTTGILSGKTVTAISAGDEHTCAVASGTAVCWGDNGYVYGNPDGDGRVGQGKGGFRKAPAAVYPAGVLAGKTVTAISAGTTFSCAVADSSTYCWGANPFTGGNPSAGAPFVVSPVSTAGVLAGKKVTAISSGPTSTCAIADVGTYCWGRNAGSQLGTGTTTDSLTPVAVIGLKGATTAIGVGTTHSCSLQEGAVYCWGSAASAATGTAASGTAAPVMTTNPLAGKKTTSVSAGTTHTCAVADGTAYCWGARGSISALGNATGANSYVPTPVGGIMVGKTVTAVSAGKDHSCAVADGAAYCWGFNGSGQLGTGSTGSSTPLPVAVKATAALAGKTVTAISAGTDHTCAIANDAAYCWGYGINATLGYSGGNSYEPNPVNTTGVLAGRKVTGISVNYQTSCAVADGAAYCWGKNTLGSLGNGNTSMSVTPVAVSGFGGKTVTSVSAGYDHTCAVADGGAYCWGSGAKGMLGRGSLTSSSVPVAVTSAGALTGTSVTAIGAGKFSSCAVAAGQAFCWGGGSAGQLGNGLNADSMLPVAATTSGVLKDKKAVTVTVGSEHVVFGTGS